MVKPPANWVHVKLPWSEVTHCIQILSKQLTNLSDAAFMGIATGGLIPAVLLRNAVNDQAPVGAVWVDQRHHTISYICVGLSEGKVRNLVLVDDIADTAHTLNLVLGLLEPDITANDVALTIATLYKRGDCPFLPNHIWAHEALPRQWLDFPWERRV
jgi:hypoxanthine phosphoribosyltransferase